MDLAPAALNAIGLRHVPFWPLQLKASPFSLAYGRCCDFSGYGPSRPPPPRRPIIECIPVAGLARPTVDSCDNLTHAANSSAIEGDTAAPVKLGRMVHFHRTEKDS
jgi:hypothetical protein